VVRVIGIHGSRIRCPVLPLSGTAAGCQEKNAVVTGCDANQQIVKDMENLKYMDGPFSTTPSWTTEGKMQVRKPDGSPVMEVATPVNAQSLLRALNEAFSLGEKAANADLKQQRDDLLAALRVVQVALASYRDGEAFIHDGRTLALEEVKYLIVDTAIEAAEGKQ